VRMGHICYRIIIPARPSAPGPAPGLAIDSACSR
jgi:hypothetical protein